MDPANWQISAGTFAEGLRPVSFALALLLSTCVLFDARRRRLNAPATAAWTLLALLFAPIVVPLYLIARGFTHPPDAAPTAAPEMAPPPKVELNNPRPEEAARAGATVDRRATGERLRWGAALPLLYLLLVAALGALYFYLDYGSVDAHLARANQAKLYKQPALAIREYRAALALEDDPHTHKLLGVELAQAGRTEEALAEYRAAERGGDPDERLSFYLATALHALGRTTEAAPLFQKFLESRLCAEKPSDALCGVSKARLQAIGDTAATR